MLMDGLASLVFGQGNALEVLSGGVSLFSFRRIQSLCEGVSQPWLFEPGAAWRVRVRVEDRYGSLG